jgi:hypothetical protein
MILVQEFIRMKQEWISCFKLIRRWSADVIQTFYFRCSTRVKTRFATIQNKKYIYIF